MSYSSKQVQDALKEAANYRRTGSYEKALERYLFAMNCGGDSVFVSFYDLASEISELSKDFAPAIEALTNRRNEKESLLRSGQYHSSQVIREWQALNDILDEKSREIEFFLELQERNREDEELVSYIAFSNVNWFRSEGKFNLLERYLNKFGQTLFCELGNLEAEIYFPGRFAHERTVQSKTKFVRKTAEIAFAIALACGKTEQADIILRRVTALLQDFETLRALSDTSKMFGAYSQRQFLLDLAGALYPDQYNDLA